MTTNNILDENNPSNWTSEELFAYLETVGKVKDSESKDDYELEDLIQMVKKDLSFE